LEELVHAFLAILDFVGSGSWNMGLAIIRIKATSGGSRYVPSTPTFGTGAN